MADVTYPCYWQKEGASGYWYWIYYAVNGKAIARSSENYVARADCTRSVQIIQFSATSTLFYTIDPIGISDSGPCPCCGSLTRAVAGYVREGRHVHAGYQVHWTLGQVERHGASFFILLGHWDAGAGPDDRYAVALRYRADVEARGFMVVDAAATALAPLHPPVGSTLPRDEVVDTALAPEVFSLVDFVWLHDERIAEVTGTYPAT